MTTNQRSVRDAVEVHQGQRPQTIANFIQDLQPEIARALPKHMDADRMARLALTVVRQTPKLAQCEPASFAGALLTSAALGLEPGVNGEAYLVPYGKECQFIIGYQGMAKLFWQSPLAQHLDAQAVYENDDFDYAYGLEPFLRHKPARSNRGDVIAYYAVAKLTTGASAFVVLSPEEVKALRGGKTGPSGKIADPMRWMERKTVLRQLIKTLPKSASLVSALNADEVKGSTLQNRQLGERAIESGQPVPDGVDPLTGEITEGEPGDYVSGELIDDLPPEEEF
jgi:recombination protein RecT